MNKIRVGVLMGGDSHEHEVSRSSGDFILDHINREKYEVTPVVISRGGDWSISPEELRGIIDIAFLTLRGGHQTGQTVHSVLKDNDIAYTGSAVLPSALALNKILASRLFSAHGFNVPKFVSAGRHSWKQMDLRELDYPLIVKPSDLGSSLGVSIVRTNEELGEAIVDALRLSREIIVQEFIPGHEVSCVVIDDGAHDIVPLPVTEILPGRGIFDYERKHASGEKHHMTPARLTKHGSEHIQQTAASIHNLIGASGMSRTDMIIGDGDVLYILEINTVPHITRSSLLLDGAESHGLTASDLLDRILDAGLRKHGLLLKQL